MGAKSGIEWTDASWTPIRARNRATGKVGWHCAHVSEACRNCYAEGMNRRLGTGLDYKPGNLDAVDIFLDEKMLLAPLKWRKPRKIFICSTTDLFGDWVKDEAIDRIFAVMALVPQHTFQVLTKRPKRMREYLSRSTGPIDKRAAEIGHAQMAIVNQIRKAPIGIAWGPTHLRLPLPNVWLGVTAENQETADARIPDLLATRAAVRFVSVEPMLSAIDLRCLHYDGVTNIDALTGTHGLTSAEDCARIDWCIAGGESGPHARPSHPEWFRSLRDQCKTAEVPYFFKQWGEFAPGHRAPAHSPEEMFRVGKKTAGRLLDGVEYSEFPPASTGMEER